MGGINQSSRNDRANSIILNNLEEAKGGHLFSQVTVRVMVNGRHDGAHQFALAVGQKRLSLTGLEQGIAFRVKPGQSLGDEGQHPQGVIAIDVPGKSDDGPSVTDSFGGVDVDVVGHGGGLSCHDQRTG